MALSKAKLKYLRSLGQKKIRENEKRFLVEGFRLTSEALSSDFSVDLLTYTKDFVKSSGHAGLLKQARNREIEILEVSPRELEGFADTVTAQGVAALIQQREYSVDDVLKIDRRRPLILALDSVSEPGNVGTTIRTADWFGVSGVLLGKGSVELYNPKVVRSTMGSIFHLPIVTDVKLVEVISRLRKEGFLVYATTVDGGQRYDEAPLGARGLILLGNEARGLSADLTRLADNRISIPRIGKAESLNVGVASGILLARFSLKQSVQ